MIEMDLQPKKTRKSRAKKVKDVDVEIVEPVEEPVEDSVEESVEESYDDPIERMEMDDEFLRDLTAPVFQANLEEEKRVFEDEKAMKEMVKNEKKRPKQSIPKPTSFQPDDEYYSNNPTPLLGRDRIILLHKVKQYKLLFPDKLKSFKIKKDPSIEDLKEYLEEMEVLVDVSSVDDFITESILGCIRIIEGVSANTKNYNVSGLSTILKMNKQFHTLCKQLYIKYNVFSNIPPEHQLVMVIITSAYICTQKNKNPYMNALKWMMIF